MTTVAEAVRKYAMAKLEADLAEMDAAKLRPPSARTGGQAEGATVVFSLRLDRDMVVALHRRAALYEMPPSVLARNLIRIGLSAPSDRLLPPVIERLEAIVADLRVLVT